LGIEIWDLNQARLTVLFGTFLVKKNVEPKQWHKMTTFKRHFVAYEISNFFMLIWKFRNNLKMTFRGFKNDVENGKFFTFLTICPY
jgi:hypothetical protein